MIVTVDHEKLFRAFQDARKELFYVGGCVRDAYTNTPTYDVDFATNATPEEVIKLLSIYDSNIRVLPTGIKFGTVTAFMPSGVGYEITTYRNEGRYEDGRHPTEVTYSKTIQEDLSRRDFTCNAMAYTLPDNLIDPYNGLQDIQDRIIRCVGYADDRFNEDKLRVIRCLRFALRYEWDIEDTTFEAALRHIHGLQQVSKERLGKELTEILSSEFNKNLPAKTLTLLQKILSEVSGATEEVVKRVTTLHNPLLRWFVLFSHKVTSNDISSLTEFAVNSDITAGVRALCKADEFIETAPERPLLKQVLNIVTTYPERLALLEGLHDYPELYLNITDSMVKNLPVSILDLKISGNDVIRVCGVTGKGVRDILQSCLNYVCRYPQHNTYNDLIEYIKDFRNEY